MPELPEIEHLKRSLEPLLIGARVRRVDLRRHDVVRGFDASSTGRIRPASLLAGARITRLLRHGKNLALLSDAGTVVCVHLGMSGQLRATWSRQPMPQRDHIHCIWRLERKDRPGRLSFRDPRRFGGLWTFPSLQALLNTRWAKLGPDALHIKSAALAERLAQTCRPVKAALLDQSVLAGVGNIYADESLFLARIDPRSTSCEIPRDSISKLATSIRATLRRSISAGGSTISDYVDGNGQNGSYTLVLRVYGRAGEPCHRCGQALSHGLVAQRTTVFCTQCQWAYGSP